MEDKLYFCKECDKRCFNAHKGLLCSLTNEKPTFDIMCADFANKYYQQMSSQPLSAMFELLENDYKDEIEDALEVRTQFDGDSSLGRDKERDTKHATALVILGQKNITPLLSDVDVWLYQNKTIDEVLSLAKDKYYKVLSINEIVEYTNLCVSHVSHKVLTLRSRLRRTLTASAFINLLFYAESIILNSTISLIKLRVHYKHIVSDNF